MVRQFNTKINSGGSASARSVATCGARVAGGARTTSSERVALGTFSALFAATLLSGLATTNLKVSAEDATEIKTSSASTVSVTVKSSCTMSSAVGTEHTDGSLKTNAKTEGIGVTTISITCNDPSGHAVYAVGYGNDTWNETRMISDNGNSISTSDPAATIDDNTSSHWYMKLYDANKITIQNSYDNYKAVPGGSDASDENGYAKVAAYTPSTGTPEATSFKTTYGVYVNAAQTAGTYTGKVKYTLVNPHKSDDSNKPKSKDPTACDLYSAKYCMQKVADWADSLESGKPVEAMDDRDGKKYTVAKLDDGKVWMTSDLNLAGGTTVTSADSNVASDYTLPASAIKNEANNNLTDSTQFSDNAGEYVFNSGTTTNCGASGQNVPCNSYYSWLVATAGGKDANGNAVTTNGYNAAYSICPKGWRLPTATTSNASATSGTNYQTGDFYKMLINYGLSASSYYENPDNAPKFIDNGGPGTLPNFLLGGYYNNGSFYNGGSYGYYWSATSYSSTYAYFMYFNSSFVYSALSYGRRFGHSVRCVFEGQ